MKVPLTVHGHIDRADADVPALGVRIGVDGAGEVAVRSNHVMSGYWRQPDATGKPQTARLGEPYWAARTRRVN